MIVIRQNEDTIEQGIVATIGFFDGVHVGHRFLIKELQDWGKELNMPSAVITFPEHPRQVLHSDYRPKLLDTFQEKMERLETTGIDYCIALDFTYELSLYSAADFIRLLAEEYHVKGLLIGYDHRFGHDRSDGFEQYVEYGGQVGMEVRKASPYDEENIRVSSSEIRRLLQEGKVEMANTLLTYPYQLRGRIVSGYKVGRTIGFPTANIEVDSPYKLLPKVGVYAVWVELLGKRYKGMLYIGKRPTLQNGDNLTIEVNILGFSGNAYNDEITVSFVYAVREDKTFESVEALREQLERDRQTVDKLLVE